MVSDTARTLIIVGGRSDHYNGYYTGVAPGAKLINLTVLDANGRGVSSGLIAALDWVIANKAAYNIRVVNLSLGTVAQR